MANHLNLPQDPELANKIIDTQHELDKAKVDQGLLGLVWGKSSSIPNNIAALIIVVLTLFGIIYSIIVANSEADPSFTIKECWSIITPMITLAFGYLFGEKMKKDTP